MKKTMLLLLAMTLSSTFCWSQFTEKELTIDTKNSVVKWKSTMLFNFGGHEGTVQFTSGNFKLDNHKITGGTFVVDMTTITHTDGEYNQGLVDHLKDEDFFDVLTYPKASLIVTKVHYYEDGTMRMTGKMTIKGITKEIDFYAELLENRSGMTTKFKIDRTKWNITYGAKSFINVKDNAISDAIEFEVVLSFNNTI